MAGSLSLSLSLILPLCTHTHRRTPQSLIPTLWQKFQKNTLKWFYKGFCVYYVIIYFPFSSQDLKRLTCESTPHSNLPILWRRNCCDNFMFKCFKRVNTHIIHGTLDQNMIYCKYTYIQHQARAPGELHKAPQKGRITTSYETLSMKGGEIAPNWDFSHDSLAHSDPLPCFPLSPPMERRNVLWTKRWM